MSRINTSFQWTIIMVKFLPNTSFIFFVNYIIVFVIIHGHEIKWNSNPMSLITSNNFIIFETFFVIIRMFRRWSIFKFIIKSYFYRYFLFCQLIAVTQDYRTDAQIVYVIMGNSALLKCEIPSFVADFVTLDSWTDNQGNEYFSGLNSNYGNK